MICQYIIYMCVCVMSVSYCFMGNKSRLHDGQPPAGCRFLTIKWPPLRSPLSQSLVIPSLLMKDLHHSDELSSLQRFGGTCTNFPYNIQ